MPRLLILCEYPTLLGGERSMLATLPAVAAAGFDVHIAAPAQGPFAELLRERGLEHVPWNTHDKSGERYPLEQLRPELAAVIAHLQPDLVHGNSLSTARIAGPVAAELRRPSIGHLRDILKLSHQVIIDLNCHTRLVSVSQATRDFHVGQGLDAARCVVIHNGVDLNEFQPRPATGYLHRELSLPANARLVCVIGQLGLRKGTDVALAAAQYLASDLSDVHWLLVGERTSNKDESRDFERQLWAAAAQTPLSGRIHFLGSRAEVSRLMNECVLGVHAARQEPLGRVLLEAAASGLPMVATDVGGTREVFPSEVQGAILVPTDDCAVLATAVAELLGNEPERLKLGYAGRRRAEAGFDIESAARRLVEQYQALLT